MEKYVWVYTEQNNLICVDFDDGSIDNLTHIYPNCIYFIAGAEPTVLED